MDPRTELLNAFNGGDGQPEGFAVRETGDWTQEGKGQHLCTVFEHLETKRFFTVDQRRYGSYHTDWDYLTPEVSEVYPHTKTVTVTEWHTTPQRSGNSQ